MQSFYSEQRTWLHDFSAGFKLLSLLLLGIGLYATQHLLTLAGISLLCTLVFASLGRMGLRARQMLWPLLFACILVILFHAYWHQVHLGLISALRMLSVTLMGIALTLTTQPSDLLKTLEQILSPLDRVGFRSQRIALQLALMLRFIEHFFMMWQQLNDAHKLRTGQSGGWRLLPPLTLHMLQTAQRVADTLAARIHS